MAKQFKFTYKVDPDIAYEFAKHNCKKCYGRGLLRYEDVDADRPRHDYCDCVRNRMRNYRRL